LYSHSLDCTSKSNPSNTHYHYLPPLPPPPPHAFQRTTKLSHSVSKSLERRVCFVFISLAPSDPSQISCISIFINCGKAGLDSYVPSRQPPNLYMWPLCIALGQICVSTSHVGIICVLLVCLLMVFKNVQYSDSSIERQFTLCFDRVRVLHYPFDITYPQG